MKKNLSITVLLLIVASLALRLFVFSGYVGFDDKYYILQAFNFSQGDFHIPNHQFGPRIGAHLINAIFVKVFGPSAPSFILFAFLCSVLNILLAYKVSELLFNNRTISYLAALIIAFIPYEVIYATTAYIDLQLGTVLSAAFYFFLVAEQKEKPGYYLLCGLLWGVAYLIKSTAVFLTLPMLVYLIYYRKFSKYYLLIGLGVLAIVGFEAVFYLINTGDAFFRRNILSNRSAGIIELRSENWAEYVKGTLSSPIRSGNFYVDRMLIEPILTLFARPEFGLFFYLVIPGVVYALLRRQKAIFPVLIWFTVLLGYTLLGTINPKVYLPLGNLFVNARYFTPVFIPGAVIGGYFIYHILRERTPIIYVILALYIGASLFAVVYDATWFDKYSHEQTYQYYKSHSDKDWVVSQDDLTGFLYFSGFSLPLDRIQIYYPKGNNQSKTIRSLATIYPDLRGIHSDSLQNLHQAYLSVDAQYVQEIPVKNEVKVIPDRKSEYRKNLLQPLLSFAGKEKARQPVSNHIIYYVP